MSNDTMKVTRQMKLREASLINLFDLEAKFADLHFSCVVNDFEHGLGSHGKRLQEHINAITREIKRR